MLGIASCGFVAFLDGVDSQVIAIGAPSITKTMSIGPGGLGLVFAAGFLGAAIGAGIGGLLADRVGSKAVLFWATMLFGLFTFLTASASGLGALIAVRLLAGFGLGAAAPSFMALAALHVPRSRRARMAGFVWSAFPLGGFVGALLNTPILVASGWPSMFRINGAVAVLAAILVAVSVTDLRTAGPLPGRLQKPDGGRNRGGVTVLLWSVFFGAFGTLGAVVSWTPVLFAHAGLAPQDGALALSLNSLGALIGVVGGGMGVEGFGARIVPLALLGTAFALAGAGASLSSLPFAVACIATAGLGLGVAASGSLAIAALAFPAATQASGIGGSMAWGRVGQIALPLCLGVVLGSSENSGRTFIVCSLAPLAAAYTALLVARRLEHATSSVT